MQGGLSSLFCISIVTNGLLCCVKFDPLALVSLQPARPARKLLSFRRQTAFSLASDMHTRTCVSAIPPHVKADLSVLVFVQVSRSG